MWVGDAGALLEHRLARTLLLTTAGFRDLLVIGRQNRSELYALHTRRPQPLVRPEDRWEIQERITADGSVLIPLQESDLEALARALSPETEVIAVCLLFSYRNPLHERGSLDPATVARQSVRCVLSGPAPSWGCRPAKPP